MHNFLRRVVEPCPRRREPDFELDPPISG